MAFPADEVIAQMVQQLRGCRAYSDRGTGSVKFGRSSQRFKDCEFETYFRAPARLWFASSFEMFGNGESQTETIDVDGHEVKVQSQMGDRRAKLGEAIRMMISGDCTFGPIVIPCLLEAVQEHQSRCGWWLTEAGEWELVEDERRPEVYRVKRMWGRGGTRELWINRGSLLPQRFIERGTLPPVGPARENLESFGSMEMDELGTMEKQVEVWAKVT